jgi:hypothetical protein
VTPASPTWSDVESFLKADGWIRVTASARGGRRQRHIFFEKELQDGRVLQTHISHDRAGTMSAGRFSLILREQLEVSREAFWQAVRTGEPVERPVDADDGGVVEHESWVMAVLVGKLHLSADEIEKLSREEAIRMVQDHWSGLK